MIGCTMTVLSNQAKSDTYFEVRKNQLAGNLGGYATDSASTVNILVGNEMLKKNGSNPPKSATNDSDDGDRDYSDDDGSNYAGSDCSDSDYPNSDYSDSSDGDSNEDVECTDDEESCGTVEYTDDEESCGATEDTDGEISIGTSGVEESVGNNYSQVLL